MQEISEILNAARNAVVHGDAGPALRLLRELEIFQKTRGQKLPDDVRLLILDLRYTAFPVLEISEAVQIVRSELMHVMERGIDIDDRLSVRYAFTTYGEHEKEREELKAAFLGNTETVAGKSVGQWLQEFDKAYSPETRDNRHIFEFLSANRQLGERDRAVLNLLLSAYENWIASPRLNVFDMAYLSQHPEIVEQETTNSSSGPYQSQAANRAYQSNRTAVSKPSQGVIHTPLLKALAEYPRLGDQLVTSEKIKLKGQSELQRPSLSNWIHYYRDELGIGFHDQVTRGRFLFQSDNGKKLGADERERINLILKSIEEEFPIDIDTDRSMIVFPARPVREATAAPSQVSREKLSFPTPQPLAPARPVKPFQPLPPIRPAEPQAPVAPVKGAPKSSFFGGKAASTANVANDTVHFSTGHVLPGEKETGAVPVAPQEIAPPKPAPSQTPVNQAVSPTSAFQRGGISRPSGSSLPRSPYSIRPLRNRIDDAGKE